MFVISLILIVGILIFYQKPLTGQMVKEICSEEEVCENVTIEICEKECEEICNNETISECSIELKEVCEEVCSGEGNETICEEVCSEKEVEICEDKIIENCEEICEDINCTTQIIENCSIQEVCIEVVIENVSSSEEEESKINETIEEIPEGKEKKSTEEIFQDEVIKEIQENKTEIEIAGEILMLSDQEKFNLISKTGESEIRIVKSEIINGRLIIKFEIGNYWIEKSYDYPDSEVEFKINSDKIIFARKLSQLDLEKIKVIKKGEFLGDYEL